MQKKFWEYSAEHDHRGIPNCMTALTATTRDSSRSTAFGYPLFETMARSMNFPQKATYTCADLATLFGVTARTIQMKVQDGTLPSRKLIGGGRFLAADIEAYLQSAGDAPARTLPGR
jgi:predicted DNA-binding transcriptional regulator AlpA